MIHNRHIYVFIAILTVHFFNTVNLTPQVPAPEAPPAAPAPAAPAPEVPAPAAPVPVSPAPEVPAPAAPASATAPAPASASAPVATVAKPAWPDTVQVDVAGKLVEGVTADAKIKKDLFNQASKIADEGEEVVASLSKMGKDAFDSYLKTQKTVTSFARDTKVKQGKIREASNNK